MVTPKSSELKTLKIYPDTHKDLEELFMGRDTFDNVIKRLIVVKKMYNSILDKLNKKDRQQIETQMKQAYEELL